MHFLKFFFIQAQDYCNLFLSVVLLYYLKYWWNRCRAHTGIHVESSLIFRHRRWEGRIYIVCISACLYSNVLVKILCIINKCWSHILLCTEWGEGNQTLQFQQLKLLTNTSVQRIITIWFHTRPFRFALLFYLDLIVFLNIFTVLHSLLICIHFRSIYRCTSTCLETCIDLFIFCHVLCFMSKFLTHNDTILYDLTWQYGHVICHVYILYFIFKSEMLTSINVSSSMPNLPKRFNLLAGYEKEFYESCFWPSSSRSKVTAYMRQSNPPSFFLQRNSRGNHQWNTQW